MVGVDWFRITSRGFLMISYSLEISYPSDHAGSTPSKQQAINMAQVSGAPHPSSPSSHLEYCIEENPRCSGK